MKTKQTSVLDNGLIWFGAAVCIAEILTGTLFAPLGFAKGLAAIVLGLAAAGSNLLKFFRFVQKESEHKDQEDRHGRF